MIRTPKHLFGLGCKPDTKKDQTPFAKHRLMLAEPVIAPHSDLRSNMPAVRDQGQLGSCTGFALTGIFMYLAKKLFGEAYLASALAVYYDERVIEGTVEDDAGAEIADGIDVLLKNGAGPESLCPYNIRKFTSKPSDDYYAAAKKDLALHSYRVDNPDGTSIRAALTLGMPVVIGFTVYPEIEGLNPTNYLLPLPNPGEESVGGHAVVICGHDDERQVYTAQNQWSSDWGADGFFEMPYAYVHDGNLTQDCHVVDQEEDPMPKPEPPTPPPVPPSPPEPPPIPEPPLPPTPPLPPEPPLPPTPPLPPEPPPEPSWIQSILDFIKTLFGAHAPNPEAAQVFQTELFRLTTIHGIAADQVRIALTVMAKALLPKTDAAIVNLIIDAAMVLFTHDPARPVAVTPASFKAEVESLFSRWFHPHVVPTLVDKITLSGYTPTPQ